VPNTPSKPAVETAREPEELSRDELQVQLGNARVQIARLEKELDTSLRRRLVNPKESAKSAVQSAAGNLGVATAPGQQGVPISTTALLCLFFFMLAYLLF
jgi:hypothetical protein